MVVFITFASIWPVISHAETDIEINTGVGYITGTNTYEIGGVLLEGRYPYFPMSRLEFPLGLYLANLDARVFVDKLRITGSLGLNINHKAQHMRDYDWGMPYWDNDGDEGPGWYVRYSSCGYSLDVQSASKSDADVLIWKADIAYRIFSFSHESSLGKGNTTSYMGIGYEHRSFQYKCSLIRQWSPSGIPGYNYAGDGSVGVTYDVDYSMPYVEFTLSETIGKINAEMGFGYSPRVIARDRDEHLNRLIYADGFCTGRSLKYQARIRYDITSRWSVVLIIDHLYLRTWGEQDNTSYTANEDGITWDSDFWTTDERVIARQSYFNLNVYYRFGLPF